MFNTYPYTDFHELNLDWILKVIRELQKAMHDFINLNTIKYADPILWDITKQYEANTVVVDGNSGNAYISVQPVPVGVALSRTEYWTQIYNYASVVETLREQIAFDEGTSTTATRAYYDGALVFINGILYRVIAPMIAGDSFVEGSNIEQTTILHEIERIYTHFTGAVASITAQLGNLSNLSTTDKTSLVNAINEVLTALTNAVNHIEGKVGDLANLTTTDKTSLVNAINEVLASLTSAVNYITNQLNTAVEPKLQNRKFLAVGDSYGDESGEWANRVPGLLQIDPANWHNLCVGGSGFVSNGVLLFINQIMNYIGDKNEITDIIVCGGLNDSVSASVSDAWWSTVRANMGAFDTYVKANYPNAKISLGYIGNGDDLDPSSLIGGRTYACRQMCKYHYNEEAANLGWNVLHNVEFALCTNKDNISSDGVHPSAAGSISLANAIAQAIVNGSCDVRYPKFEATNGDNTIMYSILNDKTVIEIRNLARPYSTGMTLSASGSWATFNNLYFNRQTEASCIVRLDAFDSKPFQYIPARIVFNGNNMSLELMNTDASGNYVTTYTASDPASYARITDIDIIIDTSYLA